MTSTFNIYIASLAHSVNLLSCELSLVCDEAYARLLGEKKVNSSLKKQGTGQL